MPTDLPSPDDLPADSWTETFDRRTVPHRVLPQGDRTGLGRMAVWMRVNRPLGDDALLHHCWLAYLSDDMPTETVRRAIALSNLPGWPSATASDEAAWDGIAYGASLDHTVWFHRPLRADEWHLYDFSCHGYLGGRGLSVGHVFTADGVHAATVAQEVLLRRARPTA
jgi:acyl-CoA thioesterase-2